MLHLNAGEDRNSLSQSASRAGLSCSEGVSFPALSPSYATCPFFMWVTHPVLDRGLTDPSLAKTIREGEGERVEGERDWKHENTGWVSVEMLCLGGVSMMGVTCISVLPDTLSSKMRLDDMCSGSDSCVSENGCHFHDSFAGLLLLPIMFLKNAQLSSS